MENERSFRLHNGEKGAAITVRVTPRASLNELYEILNDGTIKIRLRVSSDDEINKELVKFLSEKLSVPSSSIEIVAGEKGRDKLVTILDLDAEVVHKKIMFALK